MRGLRHKEGDAVAGQFVVIERGRADMRADAQVRPYKEVRVAEEEDVQVSADGGASRDRITGGDPGSPGAGLGLVRGDTPRR